MTVKVSVIIPVYNAEKYISQCVGSLLQQSLADCEFIFINDGSTDNSESILESYQKRDSRIKIYKQQNQGVSIARNKGLELAIGEYIGFADADDTVEIDYYQNLFQAAEKYNADIVFSNYQSRTDGKRVTSNSIFLENQRLNKKYIQQMVLPSLIKSNTYNSVCTKLYRSRLIKEKQIIFPKNIPLGEDGLFNIAYLCVAESMSCIDYAGYYYREVQGSATRNFENEDYFFRSLQEYEMSYPNALRAVIKEGEIHKLKSIKLIQSVYALIYIYFSSSKHLNIKRRYKYILNMVNHPSVQESLAAFKKERQHNWGDYEKCIFYMIKYKSIVGLYFLTLYSRMRNK